jgi:hypothetical protein
MLVGCMLKHAASHTQSINALMFMGKIRETRHSLRWLTERLSSNGLLYQLFHGRHAQRRRRCYADRSLRLGPLGLPRAWGHHDLLARIASGLLYAQIHSDDRNADGAVRGLPRHPIRGDDAYCWDTIYTILFLQRLLMRG